MLYFQFARLSIQLLPNLRSSNTFWKPILMQKIVTNVPRSKAVKRSTSGVRRSKISHISLKYVTKIPFWKISEIWQIFSRMAGGRYILSAYCVIIRMQKVKGHGHTRGLLADASFSTAGRVGFVVVPPQHSLNIKALCSHRVRPGICPVPSVFLSLHTKTERISMKFGGCDHQQMNCTLWAKL